MNRLEIFHCCLIVGFYGDYIFFRCFFPNFSLGHPETGIFQENFKSGIHEGFGPFSIFSIHPVSRKFLPVKGKISGKTVRLYLFGPKG